jgi:uncharacterized protein (DUF2147 family)
MVRLFLRAALSAATVFLPMARAEAARVPTGVWFTQSRGGVVQVRPCGGGKTLCGIIVGLTPSPAGKLPLDFKGGPQCRRILFWDMRPEDDGRWHGTLTNPEDGRTYGAEIWVADDGNMRLRGYIGLPLLGSTQVWPPFDGHLQPDCHFTSEAVSKP